MESQYSKEALVRFLEFVGEKGLLTKQNAQNWRVATGKILDDLAPAEADDVRNIDIDVAFRRFANRTAGKFTPTTLGQYRRRATTAVQNFVDYANNPESFKPRGQAGADKTEKHDRKARNPAASQHAQPAIRQDSPPRLDGEVLSMVYPLRKDFLAQVSVPRDMSANEARRLSAFIMTLAGDFKPAD